MDEFDCRHGAHALARALALLQDCLAELRRAPVVDATKIVRYAVWLSRAYNEAGDPARATDVLGSALADGGDQVDLRSRAAAQYELSRRLAAAGEVEHALRCADRSLSLYELDEDNRSLSEAHLAYAQRLLDVGDAEARPRVNAAHDLIGAHRGTTEEGRILVEDARQALLLGDAAAAAQRADQAVRALGEGDGAHLGDAHLVLARVQDELGELERADAAYTAAIEAIRTQDASARDLARVDARAGQGLPLVRQVPQADGPRRGGAGGVRAGRRPGALESGCAGAHRGALRHDRLIVA